MWPSPRRSSSGFRCSPHSADRRSSPCSRASSSGRTPRLQDLHHIGGPLPHYLRQRYAGSEFAYFADVAALEWAREESARAADAAPLDLRGLSAVADDAAASVRFALHPGVRLVASRWPVLAIWEAHQDPGGVRGVDLGAGPEQVLLRRAASGLVLERISAAEFDLLTTLGRGEPLGAAFDAAIAADSTFDVGAALRRFVAGNVFASMGD